MKELLEPNYAKVRLSDETATVLDLCFDCMPHYEAFEKSQEKLTLKSARQFRLRAKAQEEAFWKKVKSGGKKSATVKPKVSEE